MSAAAGNLLVALEPPGAGAVDSGAALETEAGRLVRALGVDAHFVTWPGGADLDIEALADALAALAARTRPVAVVLADTDTGRQLAPVVAYRLGSGSVVGCSDALTPSGGRPTAPRGDARTATRGALWFVKPVYGGWLEREIDAAAGTVPVATLDLSGVAVPDASSIDATVPEVLDLPASLGSPRVRHLELIPPDARSVDLVHARRIVAAGSGSASERLLPAVRELADLLEGSVGATRPVVDDGHLPKERLIGQTGRTVAPELYLALGISGSPHHVAGVRKADRVLSINRDARAPIFQFSDVGYVADLEAVLPALVEKIKEWRDAPGSRDEPR